MRVITLVLFSAIVLTVTSCEETGLTPGKNTINGQIIGGYSAMNYRIISGNNETTTDVNGRFSLEISESPYDLFIATSTGEFIWAYNDLQTRDPIINLTTEPQVFYNNFTVRVETAIPFLNSNQRVITSFIPDSGQEKVEVNSVGNLWKPITIVKWNESSSISGKYVILCFTMSEYGIITSFDRYYEKNMTLNSGMNILDTISENAPFTDPIESHVRGTIMNSNGPQQSTRSNFKVGFPNVCNQWTWGGSQNGNNFDFVVPVGLPIEFFVEGFAYENYKYSKRQIKVNPGSDNNLIELFGIQNLLTPNNYDSIPYNSTSFNWTDEGGIGIYELTIQGQFQFIQIYTSSLEANIPDLSKLGVQLAQSYSWTWRVNKFHGSGDLDQFLTKEIQLKTYEGSSRSEPRTVYLF